MTVQERNAEIVRLFGEEGMTYSAIAARMRLPVGTVSGRISQARQRGEVPYRRPSAAKTGFGRQRSNGQRAVIESALASAVTADSICADIRHREQELEAELDTLRTVRRALEAGS